eukprot:gene8977-biopygen10834
MLLENPRGRMTWSFYIKESRCLMLSEEQQVAAALSPQMPGDVVFSGKQRVYEHHPYPMTPLTRHHFWSCPVAVAVRTEVEHQLIACALFPAGFTLTVADLWLGRKPLDAAGLHTLVWDMVCLAALHALDRGRCTAWAAAPSLATPVLVEQVAARAAVAAFWSALADFAATVVVPKPLGSFRPLLARVARRHARGGKQQQQLVAAAAAPCAPEAAAPTLVFGRRRKADIQKPPVAAASIASSTCLQLYNTYCVCWEHCVCVGGPLGLAPRAVARWLSDFLFSQEMDDQTQSNKRVRKAKVYYTPPKPSKRRQPQQPHPEPCYRTAAAAQGCAEAYDSCRIGS